MRNPTGAKKPPNAASGLGKALGAVATIAVVLALVVTPLTGWSPW